ncbi:hypothetical protein CMI42_02075 [Candidatus Pacearchaeota archaeon]|nr:hypothetical protein [Candidatus Pacearchaeota archaeon]|tara:strand:- start:1531 stop:2259 length:729 start_codon:yes stop_codon:yes gene_type:complete
MNHSLKDYKPMDYRDWIIGDEARNGANIKRLGILNEKELTILEAAIPYQDQRNDPGQAEIVAYFAVKLLDYLPGKREVVVPAAILHDTGFHGGDSGEWLRLVRSGEAYETEEKRRPHQNRGCLIAGRVLERVGYSEKHQNEIADIIGDHDTRKLPTTESGTIMRAADLLWRVTYPHDKLYTHDLPDCQTREGLRKYVCDDIFDIGPDETALKKLEGISRTLGEIELENTLDFIFGNGDTRTH